MSRADRQLDWNCPASIDVLKRLLLQLPGVESVHSFDGPAEFTFRVRCSAITGINVLADMVGHANGRVFVRAEAAASRAINEQNRVLCEFCTAKDENQGKPLVYMAGFYVAVWLYDTGAIDDKMLDDLESIWPVGFVIHRG